MIDLQVAKALASELGNSTDRLNKAIVDAEAALAALRLGVPAEVVLWTGPDGIEDFLCFRKFDKEWRLVVERRKLGERPDRNATSLLCSASRDSRIDAVEALPSLVAEMFRAAQEETAIVQEATDDLRSFIAKLGLKATA